MIWLWLSGSRPVSEWISGEHTSSAEQLLEGSPLDRNIYIALLALALIVLLGRRAPVLQFLRENSLLVLFIFYCAVSIVWSDYPDVAFKRWIKSLGDYAMILIILTDQDRITALKRVFARVSFILIPISVLFIKYYPELGRRYAAHWDPTVYYTGVATDKNMLGVSCLVFGLAVFWRFLHELQAEKGERRNGSLIAQGTVLLMTGWLFAKANSMTSLSCILFGGALVVVMSFPTLAKKRALVHTMVFAGLTFCFCVLFLNMGGFLLESVGRNPTLTGRTGLWDTILGMNTNPILGTGFESFWLGARLQKLWSIYWWHPNEAHNGYLEVYLNLGWIGLVFIAGLMITGYRNVLRMLDREPETGGMLLAYFVIAVAYNFTEAAIRTGDLVWIVFLLAIFALPQTARDPKTVTDRIATPALAGIQGDSKGCLAYPGRAAYWGPPKLKASHGPRIGDSKESK